MLKYLLVAFSVLATPFALQAQQPTVQVEPPNLSSPRPLETQTASAAVRDYLESWQSMKSALEQNRADLLDRDFVGAAHDKLADTIHEQAALGIHTHYEDRSHDVQIIFYSPEGLSIQLVDNVQYDEQVLNGGNVLTSQPVTARYVVVMSPSEVRWRVRVFQTSPE